jgi:hypothetical protein
MLSIAVRNAPYAYRRIRKHTGPVRTALAPSDATEDSARDARTSHSASCLTGASTPTSTQKIGDLSSITLQYRYGLRRWSRRTVNPNAYAIDVAPGGAASGITIEHTFCEATTAELSGDALRAWLLLEGSTLPTDCCSVSIAVDNVGVASISAPIGEWFEVSATPIAGTPPKARYVSITVRIPAQWSGTIFFDDIEFH